MVIFEIIRHTLPRSSRTETAALSCPFFFVSSVSPLITRRQPLLSRPRTFTSPKSTALSRLTSARTRASRDTRASSVWLFASLHFLSADRSSCSCPLFFLVLQYPQGKTSAFRLEHMCRTYNPFIVLFFRSSTPVFPATTLVLERPTASSPT